MIVIYGKKKKKPNTSGTNNSYHPKISQNTAKKNQKSSNLKEIWSPE